MKTLIWILFAIAAGLWTGAVAVSVELTEWAVQALSSGQIDGLAAGAAQWPVPAWVALWIDPAWVQTVQTAAVAGLQWLSDDAPSWSGVMGWLAPLMWTAWGLVALLMLLAAAAMHWLAGRLTSQPPVQRANV